MNDSTYDPPNRSGPGATGGATFQATHDELIGADPLVGSAEIARTYCTNADRLTSVVAITPGRIRRVDCWLGGVGFVTLAASADPEQPRLGMVSDRHVAPDLVVALVESLVGGLPATPVDAPAALGPVGDITADGLPDDIGWMVVLSARSESARARPERIVVAVRSGGLAMAQLESLDALVPVGGATRADLQRRVAEMLGPAPRSVADLLADDELRQLVPRQATFAVSPIDTTRR